MTDLKRDEDLTQPQVKARPEDTIFQSPFSAPPAPAKDEKPAEKPDETKPDLTPAEKAAATRAKNERATARAEKATAKAAAESEPTSAESRTYSCPLCGRGSTLATAPLEMPEIMRCEGCGCDSPGANWLAPGVGHGEPTLQVGPPN